MWVTYHCTSTTNWSQGIENETFVLVAATNWVKRNLQKPILRADLLSQPLIAYDENLPLIR